MLSKKETGNEGENLATDYLKTKDYIILERNWRFSRAEIDIIARIGNLIVFVEVKTRSYTYYGQPADFVTETKEYLLMDAANAYLVDHPHDGEFRFDIISIVLGKEGTYQLEHFEDAFWPEW
jgi:putative endonuclease